MVSWKYKLLCQESDKIEIRVRTDIKYETESKIIKIIKGVKDIRDLPPQLSGGIKINI